MRIPEARSLGVLRGALGLFFFGCGSLASFFGVLDAVLGFFYWGPSWVSFVRSFFGSLGFFVGDLGLLRWSP